MSTITANVIPHADQSLGLGPDINMPAVNQGGILVVARETNHLPKTIAFNHPGATGGHVEHRIIITVDEQTDVHTNRKLRFNHAVGLAACRPTGHLVSS
ncbi:hypothetical protein COL154_013833 [Colletotrichum chrysophilum]|uniref:uncharacterized protein n=1 Tax=Colletotrichum chrysophilum TaxID=1836956 RepID=UPI002301C736|nr:uncharacterized protein COL26b_013962 [Colletotrichum chrysophilum]KAJ0296230.1 hypothetical protein Brms1b_013732 [Colletotrichum noveboracense]KAJ0336858.1 hypothetical protein KNSL1_013132 [Colletotrichum chrysophilum]KAJ0347476.1 hypothetical protein COL154_013833 [Colletotrichum chrysophilum]KAJ0360789.1 hypothetical protein COL26b_013962 [Colletotrichum chrysophilum]